jgi:hypothetical protein
MTFEEAVTFKQNNLNAGSEWIEVNGAAHRIMVIPHPRNPQAWNDYRFNYKSNLPDQAAKLYSNEFAVYGIYYSENPFRVLTYVSLAED